MAVVIEGGNIRTVELPRRPAPEKAGAPCKYRSMRQKVRVLHYLIFSWYGHGTTHGKPWHPHGIPWRDIGFYGTPWGLPGHAMGGTMAPPAATTTALHGNPTECHVNPRGTPMSTAPRLGLGLGLGFHGMPWRSAEGSVVCCGRCRGRFCRRWRHGVPRHVAKKDNNVCTQVHLDILFGSLCEFSQEILSIYLFMRRFEDLHSFELIIAGTLDSSSHACQ